MLPSPDSAEPLLYADKVHTGLPRSRFYSLKTRRRYFVVTTSLALVAVFGLVVFNTWTSFPVSPSTQVSENEGYPAGEETIVVPEPPQTESNDVLNPLNSLNGPPTQRFKDNLKPDVKYVTTWAAAGWTNDVMAYANLIYLAVITDRIPVMPMFTPSHIGGHVPPIPFGEVFDVPRLRQGLGKPVLEWREIKDPNSQEIDDLGCWNVWESVNYVEAFPRRSAVPGHLKLDISYTKTPGWIKLYQNFEHDSHATFWSVARLAYGQTRNASLVTPLPSPIHNVSLPPDEQMLCYDYLYYVCAQQPYEYDYDYSPAWKDAAQYMRWEPKLQALAYQYVKTSVGLEPSDEVPPYIAIHIRHSDFANWCGGVPVEDCFASIPVIARRVQEVREELFETKGIHVNHVIMTSDERNETWWDEVAQQGWFRVNHENTIAQYGDWYPLLIDAVIQSSGVGFVGTDRSTMSIMARRRVETWYDGATRTVMWGTPHADDH